VERKPEAKCAGLAEQLATRSVPPSPLSLLGLVRHLTEMERVYAVWALGPKSELRWVWATTPTTVRHRVALEPDSAPRTEGEPAGYADPFGADSGRVEVHGRWGRSSRVAGWVVAAILLLLTTTPTYHHVYYVALWEIAGVLVLILVADLVRRRRGRRR
jgi:Protein of unknown function (DUF664)